MLTRDNHIAAIYGASPQKASNLMVQLLAAQRGSTLESLLNKFPTKEFDTSDEYTWDLEGSTRRNYPLVEARDEDGVVVTKDSGFVGAGTAPFYLVFEEDCFADGKLFAVITW